MSDTPNFVINRTFNAPVDRVWRAWTEPELIAQWYGPNVDTIIHQFDLTPGGLWLNEMRKGDFKDLSRSVFQTIEPTQTLSWHQSSADDDWNIVANPMMPAWPRVVATDVTFKAQDDQTTEVTLVWTPFDASAEELACFEQAVQNFGGGWEAGFTLMDTVLENL